MNPNSKQKRIAAKRFGGFVLTGILLKQQLNIIRFVDKGRALC